MFTDIELALKLVELNGTAKQGNYHFNVSFGKLRRLLTRKSCEITGIEFGTTTAVDTKDRKIVLVDPSKGFIDSNLMIVTVLGARIAATMSPASLKLASKKLAKINEKSLNG